MLGTVRRFGVSHALRATAPRSISARLATQLPKWQAPSTLSSLAATRSLHSSFPRLSAATAQAIVEEAEPSKPAIITEFSDLGHVDTRIIQNVLKGGYEESKSLAGSCFGLGKAEKVSRVSGLINFKAYLSFKLTYHHP